MQSYDTFAETQVPYAVVTARNATGAHTRRVGMLGLLSDSKLLCVIRLIRGWLHCRVGVGTSAWAN